MQDCWWLSLIPRPSDTDRVGWWIGPTSNLKCSFIFNTFICVVVQKHKTEFKKGVNFFPLKFYVCILVCSEYLGIHFEERHPHKCVVMRFLEVTEKNLLWRLGLLWQRNWPVSITQHCAAFCGLETMGRCWGERHATWTWHRKLWKQHKTNCWALAFPPPERLSPLSLKVNSIV